jgi:hypothetical protein
MFYETNLWEQTAKDNACGSVILRVANAADLEQASPYTATRFRVNLEPERGVSCSVSGKVCCATMVKFQMKTESLVNRWTVTSSGQHTFATIPFFIFDSDEYQVHWGLHVDVSFRVCVLSLL